jgi:phosphohistidine phosphatase
VDIYILRHGKAEPAGHGMRDADRALTKKGRDEIGSVGAWLASQEMSFRHIAASPLVRAQETARIVAEALEETDRITTWDSLVPEGEPDAVLREIGRYPDDLPILLVGHEPLLSAIISRIICGNAGAGIVMTKGGLAKIRNYSWAQRPSGELHWLITARHMADMLRE